MCLITGKSKVDWVVRNNVCPIAIQVDVGIGGVGVNGDAGILFWMEYR